MRIENLGKYISEVSVRNKKSSVTDVFSVTNSQGFIKSTDYFSKEVFSKDISNYKIVGKNEFAYNPSRINVGSIDYLKQKNQVVISPLYVVFKCNNALNEEFLKVFLKSPVGISRIRAKTKGAVRDTLSFGSLCEIKIPILPIDDQLHIANLLSKAENLIAQRKESIRLLDEFLKSTFLEMFGDPVRNEKGWDVTSLSEFGSLKNGLNYTKSESGVNVRCLGVGDFKEYSKLTDMESLQILSLTSEPNKEYFLKDGDLVFVRSNGNRELVGRCLLVFPKSNKVTFSGFCIRYRIEKNGLNPVLISHLFRVPTFRNSMLSGGKGANIQNISQQTLEKLKIPIPPIELQTQFARIVEKTEALKTQYQQSLQELENLYGSLSQKAFRGELKMKQNV